MFCTQCGAKVSDKARFCGRCGKQISHSNSLSPLMESISVKDCLVSLSRPQDIYFSFFNETFEVTPDLYAFNDYRSMFKPLAKGAADEFLTEYVERCKDFNGFVTNLAEIYRKYLYKIVKQAVYILVAEDIWTVTEESFIYTHVFIMLIF